MKKLIRLIRVQLWAVIGDILSIGNSRKKKPKVLYVGVLLFTLMMSMVSFFYSFMLGNGLLMFDSLNILPAMMMAITCIIILMTTVFKIKGTVFGFRDYDMVMSLPVSTGTVVACRLIILYVFNFLFVVIMIVPMLIAYAILAQPGPIFFVIGLTVMFFIPLVPIVIASVLGTLIAYAASKFRYHNLLNIILSMGLLMMIMGLSFSVQDNGQELVDMGKAITNQVNSIYPLAQMFTDAVVSYDIAALLEFIGISLVSFALYTFVVKLVFKKINTLMMTGRAYANYKMGKLKTSSPFQAFYQKELRRYFASSLYVLNTGFGIVMLTVAAVASIFVDLGKIIGDPTAVSSVTNNLPLMMSFCVVMTCTSASSISLEGKSLWIIKSLPVKPKTIYLAKIAVNLTIAAPALIDVVILGNVLKLGVPQTLVLMLVTAACAIFTALLGLLVNITLPNFNWTSEVAVIKQSAACMISIFTCIGYVAVQFAFLFLVPSFLLANLGFFLVTIALDALLFWLIMTYGCKRYYAF